MMTKAPGPWFGPRRLVRCLRLGLVLGLFFPAFAASQGGTLAVANKSGDTVSFIDLTVGREMARLPVIAAPHEVAISPDGRTVLVGEYGPDGSPGHTVAIVDLPEARITGRIDVGSQSRPHSLRFLPDGERAVVTLQDSDLIALLDVPARRVLKRLSTGGRESHMVRLSPDGRLAFVSSRLGEGTLSIVDLEGNAEPRVIVTGKGAEGFAVTPDGNEVWVLDRLVNQLSVVDTRTLRVTQRIPTGVSPNRIEISAEGEAVFTNGSTSQEILTDVELYDVATKKRIKKIPLRGGRPHQGTFGLMIKDRHVFVSESDGGRILRFNLDNFDQPEILISGRDPERPDGMVWSPHRLAGLREPERD